MEVNNDTLITKTDRTGKRELWKKKKFASKKDKILDINFNAQYHLSIIAVQT